MSIRLAAPVLLLALSVACIACAAPTERMPAPQPEPPRARAALATLIVANATDQRVSIAYRITSRAANEVTVGHVPPGATVELAPVPAGEPIVLVARNAAGAELSLPARSFEIDSRWTWEIPRDARFVRPAPTR